MKSKKSNKKIIILIIVLVIVLAFLIGLIFNKKDSFDSRLSKSVNNTNVEKSGSYRMDLRIYGIYNNKGINNIIMINNYKNTDKDITITVGDKEEKYLIKDNKKYKVENEKLNSVDKVPYENTEVYLNGVKKLKSLTEEKDQKISTNTYKVYKGLISSDDIKDILKASGIDVKLDKDVETEVWLTNDNYVYKVYYRLDKLTIYASYFGYGNMSKVNLDIYK